jgi:diguanylate cyclase (GGDEF)-like protein
MTLTARTLFRSTLLTLWLLLPAASAIASSDSAQDQQPAPAVAEPGTPIQRAEWSLIRPTPMVTLHLRRVVGYVMLVPAGTLFMLYLFRPRPYVIAGAFAWAAGSLMLLVLSVDSSAGISPPNTITTGRLGIGAWALSSLAFGATMRCASVWFRKPSVIPRSMFWAVAGGTAWILMGASLFTSPGGVLFPTFALMTMWHLRSAVAYLEITRQHRFVGAAMSAIGVFGVAMVNTFAAGIAITTGGIGEASTNVAYLNFLFSALLMLGMHLIIFEDLIEELRAAASEIAESRDEMRAMAVTDPLTRCYNRRLLYEITEHELEQHRRYELPLSILYIDIDHFKAINDTRGHQTGDEVLKTMGAILRELTRQADYVFRWGGDEFVVLLSASETDAKIKAQQIRKAFLESAIIGNLPDGVDVSIGTVPVPPETTDFDPLIDQADREMYRRKRTLGN